MAQPNLRHIFSETAVDLKSAADCGTLTVPCRMTVYEVGVIIIGYSSPSGTPVIKFDKRPTAGSDSGRGDGDIGAVTKAVASLAAGKVLRKAVNVTVDVGDQIVAQVTTAAGGTTLTGIPYVLAYPAGSGVEADHVASD